MESDCVKIILLEGKFIGKFKSDLLPTTQNGSVKPQLAICNEKV
jgi:hypothetical protein